MVLVKSWGTLITGAGHFNRPAGLTYESGMVYVADTKNNRIEKFDKQGNFVQMWGTKEREPGQLVNPVSISSDPNSEYLYVAHGGDKRIEVFDKHGKYIESWGLAGVGNGQLKRAVSITFGNDNRVYVTDKDKSVIDIFSMVPHANPYTVKS